MKRSYGLVKLSNTVSGIKKHLLVKLDKSVIWPIFDYSCSVYTDASKTNLPKLDKLQHYLLCKTLGVSRVSSKINVNVESYTFPYYIRRIYYTLKYGEPKSCALQQQIWHKKVIRKKYYVDEKWNSRAPMYHLRLTFWKL